MVTSNSGIEVEFGWLLDGAPWTRDDTLNRVRLGPAGMLSLLRTRLGLGGEQQPPALRVAAYLKALRAADSKWCRDSLEVAPWGTASHLLNLRDEAVAAGWQVSASPQLPEISPRLSALVESEAELRKSGSAPPVGYADQLRELLDHLVQLADDEHPNLGLRKIVLSASPDSQSEVWPCIFTELARLGVPIEQVPLDTNPNQRVTVYECGNEFEAAAAASIYLDDHEVAQVLATRPTLPLDYELSGLDLPTIGVVDQGSVPEYQGLLRAALHLRLRPERGYPADPKELYSLLAARIAGGSGDALFSGELRRRLRKELEAVPSPAGEGFQRVLADGAGEEAQRLQAFLAACMAPSQPSLVDQARQTARWLREQVGERDEGDGGSDADARRQLHAQLDTFLSVLDMVADMPLSIPFLLELAGESAPKPLLRAPDAQAAPWTTVNAPAHCFPEEGGTVLWWGAVDNTRQLTRTWTEAEAKVMSADGATLHSATEVAQRDTGEGQRGLRGAAHVVVFFPKQIAGQPQEKHPLLQDLLVPRTGEDSVRPEGSPAFKDPSTLIAASPGPRQEAEQSPPQLKLHTSPEAAAEGERRLESMGLPEELQSLLVPNASAPMQVVDGTDVGGLMPDRLSVSSAEALLTCPVCWTLQRTFSLTPRDWSSLPTDNRLLGLLAHKVVEMLPTKEDRLTPVTETEIGELFDAAVTQMAAELLQPGQAARTDEVRTLTVDAVAALVKNLDGLDVEGVTVEKSVKKEVAFPATYSAADQHAVPFVGRIDLTGTSRALDQKVVLDMKWTNSPKRFTELYAKDQAIQLAAYAQLLPDDEAAGQSSEPVRLGYFFFKTAEFFPPPPGQKGAQSTEELAAQDLWERFVDSVGVQLDLLSKGVVTSVPGALAAKQGGPADLAKQLREWAKEWAEQVGGDFFSPLHDKSCAYSATRHFCGAGEELL